MTEYKNEIYIENDDTRIDKIEQVLPPVALLEKFPASDVAVETVRQTRKKAHNIIHRKDDRLLVVMGPCSIHDPVSALEYAKRIKMMREKYQDSLEIIMRVYFEKPRTTVGWKGLINDPHLNGTFELNEGLRLARKLLSDVNDLGVPAAGEFFGYDYTTISG
ncbi:phospho-2-dehydro-3-deoxyheptonate aldolase [Pasteurella multocida]|nr:phospho-2-dehydro-3-deoxyheptonate aldolase [Pasteurella multocida]